MYWAVIEVDDETGAREPIGEFKWKWEAELCARNYARNTIGRVTFQVKALFDLFKL